MASLETVTSPVSTASSTPRRRTERTARRMSRRRTYPRPSLPGRTPSPMSMRAERTWSATTRMRTSSWASAPYFFPVISSVAAMTGKTSSISYMLALPWRR